MFSSRPANELKFRNRDEDYLKAVLDQIAERESVGGSATPYLLSQKADLEARLGLTKPVEPVAAPVLSAVVEPLEHKAEVPAPEHAVPEAPESARRPGRPKRVADDAAAGS